MSDEWGPWIEHDGLPRPELLGVYMRCRTAGGREEDGVQNACGFLPPGAASLWVWASIPIWQWHHRIIRYRIRRPRALIEMIERVENLPAPKREKVDA